MFREGGGDSDVGWCTARERATHQHIEDFECTESGGDYSHQMVSVRSLEAPRAAHIESFDPSVKLLKCAFAVDASSFIN